MCRITVEDVRYKIRRLELTKVFAGLINKQLYDAITVLGKNWDEKTFTVKITFPPPENFCSTAPHGDHELAYREYKLCILDAINMYSDFVWERRGDFSYIVTLPT